MIYIEQDIMKNNSNEQAINYLIDTTYSFVVSKIYSFSFYVSVIELILFMQCLNLSYVLTRY